jgi:hypothetical protein
MGEIIAKYLVVDVVAGFLIMFVHRRVKELVCVELFTLASFNELEE